jgi:two-component system phosphate regulon response regulator OmpR
MSSESGRGAMQPSEQADEAPHLLVIDDDNRLRALLRRYLSEHGYRVTEATDAADARARLAGMTFDLLIVDVMMPGETGLALTRALRELHDLPILMLTAMGAPEERIAGLEAGADDYLAKPFEPRELLLRVATILRRTRNFKANAAAEPVQPVRLGRFVFDPARAVLEDDAELLRLTSTEASLLCALAEAAEQTLKRATLCERAGLDVNGRALDVQITRLRRKIEPDPRRPRYLVTVWGEGYVLRPDRKS